MNVLVLAAHPDDEVLGCGGTIPKLADQGHNVHIAILGEGITSRYPERRDVNRNLVATLHDTSRRVGKILGAAGVEIHGFPDNRLDTIPLLDVVKVIEDLVDRLRPERVYTQNGGDLNIDHCRLFRATLTATRPMRDCPVKELYAYQVASSSEWAFNQFEPVFHPNVFVDIADSVDTKIRAMDAYESEARTFPHPRSPEALRAAAAHWGAAVGVSAAEPFRLIRKIY